MNNERYTSGSPETCERDFKDVEAVTQAIRLELYRENIGGALSLARTAYTNTADPRYREQVEKISSLWRHLDNRDAYIAAQEAQYRSQRGRYGLKLLERRIRVLLGRKTPKVVRRTTAKPEFVLLEREILACRPAHILDAGAGEGRAALALAARHPWLHVDGVEVSRTNVKIARQLNRFANVKFYQGLVEEVDRNFPTEHFDLIYSFAVLEHVRDVDATLATMLRVLKPGGRLCFEVPMREYEPIGVIPEYISPVGFCDHVRIFTEAELHQRFGSLPGFALTKINAPPKPHEVAPFLRVVAFGSFFVAFSKPSTLSSAAFFNPGHQRRQ